MKKRRCCLCRCATCRDRNYMLLRGALRLHAKVKRRIITQGRGLAHIRHQVLTLSVAARRSVAEDLIGSSFRYIVGLAFLVQPQTSRYSHQQQAAEPLHVGAAAH